MAYARASCFVSVLDMIETSGVSQWSGKDTDGYETEKAEGVKSMVIDSQKQPTDPQQNSHFLFVL